MQEHTTLQEWPLQESWRIVHRATNGGREGTGSCEPKEYSLTKFSIKVYFQRVIFVTEPQRT